MTDFNAAIDLLGAKEIDGALYVPIDLYCTLLNVVPRLEQEIRDDERAKVIEEALGAAVTLYDEVFFEVEVVLSVDIDALHTPESRAISEGE